MQRRWLIRLAAFALLHYLVLVLLESFIYLLVHIPTPVVKLDPVIVGLTYLQQALTLPRWLLRQLWPGESSPALLNGTLAVINCLAWGSAYTYLTRKRWRHAWENAT